jgi:hypothetical protein
MNTEGAFYTDMGWTICFHVSPGFILASTWNTYSRWSRSLRIFVVINFPWQLCCWFFVVGEGRGGVSIETYSSQYLQHLQHFPDFQRLKCTPPPPPPPPPPPAHPHPAPPPENAIFYCFFFTAFINLNYFQLVWVGFTREFSCWSPSSGREPETNGPPLEWGSGGLHHIAAVVWHMNVPRAIRWKNVVPIMPWFFSDSEIWNLKHYWSRFGWYHCITVASYVRKKRDFLGKTFWEKLPREKPCDSSLSFIHSRTLCLRERVNLSVFGE